MHQDKFYMKTAIDEAKKATDMVYPNPKVGCVIVQNEQIVSKGYHKKYGDPHAEAEAINNCDIELNTTQKTFKFYEKFGFDVIKITPNYYAKGLDRYDMLHM